MAYLIYSFNPNPFSKHAKNTNQPKPISRISMQGFFLVTGRELSVNTSSTTLNRSYEYLKDIRNKVRTEQNKKKALEIFTMMRIRINSDH